MLNSLIMAHKQLEKELEHAISKNLDTAAIRAIDSRLSDLDRSIRNSVPLGPDEARLKLNYFLSVVADDFGGDLAERDFGAIEELFNHILQMVHDPFQGHAISSAGSKETRLHS